MEPPSYQHEERIHTCRQPFDASELVIQGSAELSKGILDLRKGKAFVPRVTYLSGPDGAEPQHSPFVEIITVVTSVWLQPLLLLVLCGKALADGFCAAALEAAVVTC